MNYSKLGNFEAICLIVVVFVNHIVLNLPQMILNSTGSASILNTIYILLIVIIFAILILKLLKKFIGLDIIDISEYLGGKPLKILIGILCIIYLIFETVFLTRMFSQNLLLVYFPNYPISFIIFLFLFIGVVANIIGKKSIIKTNAIIVPIALFSILFTFIFVADMLRIERSLPIFNNGLDKIFLSGASNIFAFNGLFFLFFISPMLNKKEDMSKVTLWSVLICGIFLILSIATLIFAFSDIYSVSRLAPIYFIIINSRLSAFLERPEAIFIFIWTLALMSFINIAVMFAMALNGLFNFESIANAFYKYGSLILIFGIFTLILILAYIKKRRSS